MRHLVYFVNNEQFWINQIVKDLEKVSVKFKIDHLCRCLYQCSILTFIFIETSIL